MIISIDKKPDSYTKNSFHLWADVVEMLCVISLDKEVTRDEFLRRSLSDFKENIDFYSNDEEDNDNDENILEMLSKFTLSRAKEQFGNDVFLNLLSRVTLYGHNYPFTIEGHIVKMKQDVERYKPYIALLLSSMLPFLTVNHNDLTSDFELISVNALRKYLGDNFEVFLFGASSGHTQAEYRSGSKALRFANLSEQLFGNFKAKGTEPSLSSSSGDKGVDLIAVRHTGDKQRGRIVILGQCKCSNKWPDFFGLNNLGGLIEFFPPHINSMFIPFSFRSADNGWHDESLISNFILFDRYRILALDCFPDWSMIQKTNDMVNALLLTSEEI